MNDSKTFVLTCEDGFKISVTVVLASGKVAITSMPAKLDAKYGAQYDAWLVESVVPTLLDWLPDSAKAAVASLGAQILGGKSRKGLDKRPQDDETEPA